jgi:gentisate 1,2-dioxygenase
MGGITNPAQAPSLAAGDAAVRYGSNLMPVEYRTDRRTSPLLVYPYDRTREALERLAKAGPLHPAHGIKMRYANPLTRTAAAFGSPSCTMSKRSRLSGVFLGRCGTALAMPSTT